MREYISETRSRLLVDDWAEAVRAFHHVAERFDSEDTTDAGERLARLLEHLERDQPQRRRLPIRSGRTVYFLDVDNIDWLEAANNYVKVHADRKTHVVRQTLQHMEETLSPRGFIRIHRSAVVNIAHIREIQPWFGGEYLVVLRDGAKVTSSRAYRPNIRTLME